MVISRVFFRGKSKFRCYRIIRIECRVFFNVFLQAISFLYFFYFLVKLNSFSFIFERTRVSVDGDIRDSTNFRKWAST